MLVMGNQELLFLIVQDITEKWQTEQENTRLQEKDRLAALGQMAAGIAHDFNNIMAVITLYTQLVLYDESLSQKTQHHLQTVDEQASRASELIQQILDFSRNTRLERKPLNLVPFMKEQIKLLQRTLPETIFITFTNKSASVMALVDPTRIQQVMMNLSLNARDAIEGDGKLQISLEDQQFDTENELTLPDMTPGRWLKLEVTDNGHGMLPEITARIFEPFFTTKAPNEGTGLGLAQVYGIIQQHNGHIQVFSKPNWGTTFNIYLPSLVNPETDRKSKQDQSLPLGNSEVILVAEDDSSIQTAVAASLEMLNYRVILAQDGYEALAELKHNRGEIDLILSDVVMPKMGGVELLVAVREMGFTLPIVLMTGYMVEKSVQALRPFQPTPIINKPWQLSELADVLQGQLKPETGV